MEEDSNPTTLGQYLEQGRKKAGLSLRQLAKAAGIPMSTVNHLLKDEIERPAAEHLQSIANVLELDMTDVFGFMGITPPSGLPGIAPYLRATTGLRGEDLNEATEQIQKIIDKYNDLPPDK
ncbi:helix-turn-helix transcriptional regulator [Streptomyces sp. NPDC093970]|uniref:helix-turn-helix domain-containing protein n=1 Tax=Streptomyces sp. NPDC093970 TaxID=3155076 RepID=UPI003413823D